MNAFEEIAYADGDTPLTGLALHPQGDARAAVAIFPLNVTIGGPPRWWITFDKTTT